MWKNYIRVDGEEYEVEKAVYDPYEKCTYWYVVGVEEPFCDDYDDIHVIHYKDDEVEVVNDRRM